MGQMALGYGIEFHLLRWLGRHRDEFDNRIKKLLEFDNVTWLDFDFDSSKLIPDNELIGISFLDKDPNYKELLGTWKREWPQTGNKMNWDLVGCSIQNNIKTWILVEAKAHIGEIKQDCGASENSLERINKTLIKTAHNLEIVVPEKQPWTKNYYQLANRIYILDLFKRHEINVILLNIYFIGDLIFKSRKSPQTELEWEAEIHNMKDYLGISKCNNLPIYDLFLDIDK